MPLHYLRPEDEPRECPRCCGCGARVYDSVAVPGARPDVEVRRNVSGEGWIYQFADSFYWNGPYPTEAEALAAARKAAGLEE